MAANRRWFIPVRRTVISVVLGVIAIFIVFGSWGMHSWRWLSVGIALLAGGIGLAVISAMTSTVRGTAHVLAVNEPPALKHVGRCTLSVIVYARNTEPIFIKLMEDDVPLEKWPHVNDDLPISVAASDARVVTVLWDQVPTHKKASTARRRAEARAETPAAPTDDLIEPTPPTTEPPTAERPTAEPAVTEPYPPDDVPTVYAKAVPEPDPVDDDASDGVLVTASGTGAVLDLSPSEYSVQPADDTGTHTTAVVTGRRRRGKPSPRPRAHPRPASDDFDMNAETVTAISFGDVGQASQPEAGQASQPEAGQASQPEAGAVPPKQRDALDDEMASRETDAAVGAAITEASDDLPYDQNDETTGPAEA